MHTAPQPLQRRKLVRCPEQQLNSRKPLNKIKDKQNIYTYIHIIRSMMRKVQSQATQLFFWCFLILEEGCISYQEIYLFNQGLSSPWHWWIMVGKGLRSSNTCAYIHAHFKLFFGGGIISDLQKSCKDSTVFPSNVCLAPSNINIFCNHGTFIQTKTLPFTCTVNYTASFLWISPLFLVLFPNPGWDMMLDLVFMYPQSSPNDESHCLSYLS